MAKPLRITLPDGSAREYPPGTNGLQEAESIGRRLARDAVAIAVDGEVMSLQQALPDGAPEAVKVEILTREDKRGLEVIRHSAAHVMAEAIQRMRPEAKLWKGPPVDDPRYGFYYDIDLGDRPLGSEDLPEVERLMA